MKKKKDGFSVSGAIAVVFELCCALALGGMFYAAMAYQLAGGDQKAAPSAAAAYTPAPIVQGLDAGAMYPGALMALEGMQPVSETAQDERVGETLCRVITRIYETESGVRAEAVSAYPAAYLERMALEGYAPQLITGFTLAGVDAVYALSGENCALYAREGERVYALFMPADEQAAYALGAASYLEE